MSKMDELALSIKMTVIAKEDNGATLGKGVIALLEGVRDDGSLNKAAKNLKMAYSKAWRIVKETEEGFGFLLIDRDGARGSTLTAEGKRLLEIYELLEKEIDEYANKRFAEEVAKID